MNLRSTKMKAVVAIVLFDLVIACAAAETIHVPRDYQSISVAISNSSKGDTILVEPGVYYESIQMKPGITLRSSGDNTAGKQGMRRAEVTILDGSKLKRKSLVTMANDSVLDGFTVRNLGNYDEKKWNSHYKTQGNNQPHEHIGRASRAPVLIACSSCKVLNNIVHHNGHSGIVINGSQSKDSKPHVKSNICYRNMGAGISAMLGTQAVISQNQCYENFYAGIGHNNASPHVFENVCYKNIRAGIGISNGACPLVEDNKCFKNRRAGIGSRTGKNTQPMIRSNQCYENDMAGIGSEENAAPVIVENRCFKNKLAGIGTRLHASPTIVGNHSYENGKAGIGSEGDSTPLIVDNVCERNSTSGIGFAPCTKGSARVLNNRLKDNRLVAIGIHSGWKVYAAGNQLYRLGGMPPLVMVFQGAKAKFVSNEMKGGGVAGIRCAGELVISQCDITGFEIRESGPPNFGVWALPGAVVKCNGNTFANWRHAVSTNGAKIEILDSRVKNYSKFAFVVMQPKEGSTISNNVLSGAQASESYYRTDQPDRLIVSGNRSTKGKSRD